jgi:hypothetical protein
MSEKLNGNGGHVSNVVGHFPDRADRRSREDVCTSLVREVDEIGTCTSDFRRFKILVANSDSF